MTIYFTAAISQSGNLGEQYKRIVDILEASGNSVIHEHITSITMRDIKGQMEDANDKERVSYYKKVIKWINMADVVVGELSFPSTLNIGHEVSLALDKGKPVVGLYNEKRESIFFRGIDNDKFIYASYDDAELKSVLLSSIKYAHDLQDTRFNFFISPKHQNFLDHISKTRKVPRAVFLRNLIEEEMEKDEEYRG